MRVALFAAVLMGCSADSGVPAAAAGPAPPAPPPPPALQPVPPPAPVPTTSLRGLVVSTGDLTPAFAPTVTEYWLSANGSLFPIDVTPSADPALTIAIDGEPVVTDVAASVQLAPLQDLVVEVSDAAGRHAAYTVHYLAPALPTFTVSTLDATHAGSEAVLLTPENKWLLVVDRTGQPLYYRILTPDVATDFKAQHVGGKTYYVYVDSTGNDATVKYDGKAHVLDDHMRELSALDLLPNRDHAELAADIHDFLMLGDEHYLLMSYVQETVDLSDMNPTWSDDATVFACVVQEVDHGSVVFEWRTTDVPSLFTDSVDQNTFTDTTLSDYAHMNAFQIDPIDGNVIVSLRHTSSVLKLDHATGAVIWTLGGKSDQFGLAPEQLFSHQHHVRRQDDGTYLMFDNGNDAHPTRVLHFGLDEDAKTVTSFEVVYERPADQPDTSFMGSAFRLAPARYLIGWGGRTDTSAAWPAVTEIVDGAPVWSLTFTTPTTLSYRAAPITAN
jgi:hypothetical protein